MLRKKPELPMPDFYWAKASMGLLSTRPLAVPSSRGYPTTTFLRFAQLLSLPTFKHLLGLGPSPRKCLWQQQLNPDNPNRHNSLWPFPCGQMPGMRRDADPQNADKSKAQTSEGDASRGAYTGAAGLGKLGLNWNHIQQNKSHTLLSPFITLYPLSVEWNPASFLALPRQPCLLLSVLI